MDILNQQTFTISYKYDNQLKVFGQLSAGFGQTGIWYTSNITLSREGDSDGMFAPLLPALGESFWFNWVWSENYDMGSYLCNEPQGDTDHLPGEYLSVFDYRATCVTQVTITPCAPPAGDYGQSPVVNFTRGGESGGDECAGGTISAIPSAAPSYEDPQWSQFIFTFGPAGPGPSITQVNSSTVSDEAGYESTNGSGCSLSDNFWEERKVTLLPSMTTRFGDSYYDSSDGYASQYGNWLSSGGDNLEIRRSLPFEDAAMSTRYTGTQTSTFVNEYGNNCSVYEGTAIKWNGLMGEFRTTDVDGTVSCVNTVNAGDQGREFSIPQGYGTGTGTPYEDTFTPEGGLKILKSYDNWNSRVTSIYYLASDGRYVTVSSSPLSGVYELNKKDETLILRGIMRGPKCVVGSNIEDNYAGSPEECVTQGECESVTCKYYNSGQEIITMDESGFTSGHMTGVVEDTQYKKYYDETLQWVDDLYYTEGSVMTHPIWFDDSIGLTGTWCSDQNCNDGDEKIQTWYINNDLEFITVQKHNNSNTVGASADGGSYGGGNITTMYGELCLDGTCAGEYANGEDVWYGYMFLTNYGDPDCANSSTFGEFACDEFYFRTTPIGFTDTPGYNTINYNTQITTQYFVPDYMCNCLASSNECATACNQEGDVCCQGNDIGWVPSQYDWITNMLWGETFELVWGCTDPMAENFDVNANYNDGSCEYDTGGMEVTLACDANLDGGANVLDVVLMVNWVLGSGNISDQGIANIDVNGDGTVNILDVVGCVVSILDSNLVVSDNNLHYLQNELGKIKNNGDSIDYLLKIYSKIERKPAYVDRKKLKMWSVPVPEMKSTVTSVPNRDIWFKNLQNKRTKTMKFINKNMRQRK